MRLRKDSGSLQAAVINDSIQTFSKNVGNREGLRGWSGETTDGQLVALVIRMPEVGSESH